MKLKQNQVDYKLVVNHVNLLLKNIIMIIINKLTLIKFLMIIILKRSKCKQPKLYTEFYKSLTKSLRLETYCKQCDSNDLNEYFKKQFSYAMYCST